MCRWLAYSGAPVLLDGALGDLRGAWREVPESTFVTIRSGQDEVRPFVPLIPSMAA